MVVSEHPELIEGRRRLIYIDVLDSDEASDDGSIYNGAAALDESGSGETGVITGVTQSGTEDVEEVQRVVKSSFISSYMMKPLSLLTRSI